MIDLSLVVTALELINVVLPFTTKLPVIVASLLINRLAPVMLPVAEINPAVNKLPPVMLALALTVFAVITLAPAILPPDPLPVIRFPPVTLPVTDTTAPVKLAVFTIVVNMPLLAVTLPLAL